MCLLPRGKPILWVGLVRVVVPDPVCRQLEANTRKCYSRESLLVDNRFCEKSMPVGSNTGGSKTMSSSVVALFCDALFPSYSPTAASGPDFAQEASHEGLRLCPEMSIQLSDP